MKNKLFPLLSIIIFVVLVGTAATCNLCGIIPSSENDVNVTSEQNTENITESDDTSSSSTTESPKQTEEITSDPSKVIESGTISSTAKQIALTFDAGWLYENTLTLLDLLDEYEVKATFFVRGLWVSEHPELAKEIVNRGHDMGNHSLTHGHMNSMTDIEVENEIRETTDIIKETTGYLPLLFRPPYGEYDERILKILKEAGYSYTVMWTVDSHDWAEELSGVKITKDYLVNRVLGKASDSGIILMHVGGYETINALPEIINGLRSQGYEFVTVDDML